MAVTVSTVLEYSAMVLAPVHRGVRLTVDFMPGPS